MTLPLPALLGVIFLVLVLAIVLLSSVYCAKKERRDKFCRLFNYYRREYSHHGGSSTTSGRHSRHLSPPESYAYSPPASISSAGGSVQSAEDGHGDHELLIPSTASYRNEHVRYQPKKRPQLDWELLLDKSDVRNDSKPIGKENTPNKENLSISRETSQNRNSRPITRENIQNKDSRPITQENKQNRESQPITRENIQNKDARPITQEHNQTRENRPPTRPPLILPPVREDRGNQSVKEIKPVNPENHVSSTATMYRNDRYRNSSTRKNNANVNHQSASQSDKRNMSYRRPRSYSQGDLAKLRKKQLQESENGSYQRGRSGSYASLNKPQKPKGILKSASTYEPRQHKSLNLHKSVRISESRAEYP